MPEYLQFNSEQQADEFFRESRVFFNEEIVEKLPQLSIYYGAENQENWPENSLPTQQGFRFGRGFYDRLLSLARLFGTAWLGAVGGFRF